MDERQVGLLGATSLVGECLLQRLVCNHYHIIAFSRHSVAQNHKQITWKQTNILNIARIKSEKKVPSWICVTPIWVLSNYLDYLLAYGVKRIIIVSSTSRFTKNTSFDRSEQKIALQLIEGEESVQKWAIAHGIECIILRPTLIYGYGRDKNITEIVRFIRRFGFFPVFGSARGLRQPIHAEDVASACLHALNNLDLTNRCYNLTGGEVLPYYEMVRRVFEALGLTPRIIKIPLHLFQIAIWILKWLPRYQHWTVAMAKRMSQDLIFDNSDARKDLAFSPRPFKLTVEDLPSQTS